MTKNLRLGLLCAAAAALAACLSTARYVEKTPNGGAIQLSGDPELAKIKAKGLMAEHCKYGYQVTSEGEKIIGTEAEQRQESKMKYSCKPAPEKKAAAASPPAAPPPVADTPDGGAAQ